MDVTTVLRVAFSLAVVMGLLWLSYRVADRSRRSAPAGRSAQLTVVARQGLSQKTAAVLLDTGGTRYLLGVTDSSVTIIDQGPAPVVPPAPGPASPKHAVRGAAGARFSPFDVMKAAAAPRSAVTTAVTTSGAAAAAPDAPDAHEAPTGTTDLAGPAGPAGPVDQTGPADQTDLVGVPASPSFDEAVLAAQLWLDDALVPSGAVLSDAVWPDAGASVTSGAARSSAGPAGPPHRGTMTAVAAAPSGVRSEALDTVAVRSLLAADTWRQAARAVWGPRR